MIYSKPSVDYTLVADKFLDSDSCDLIIEKYKKKDLIDWSKNPEGFFYCSFTDYQLINNFQELIEEYKTQFPSINLTSNFWNVNYFNFKWFKPGSGFTHWHCEHTKSDPLRILCLQIYLSDHDCGTEFYNQNYTVTSKKGRAVIFPTFWTHCHRGQVCPENKDRYLLSAYIEYV
jgi:hypothetical protein